MTSAPANKGKRYPAETLTADEVRRLIRASTGDSSTVVRNRAMVAVTYRGALRAAEVLALRPGDVDLDSGTVRVLDGKGHRPRTVAIDGEAVALVAAWAERRRSLGLNGRQRLFSTLRGKRLDTSYLRRLLPRLAKRAGIERRVNPHALRHTRAKELAEAGTPMNVIRDALGHSTLATTDAYLRDVAPQQVIEAMQGGWRL